MDHQKRRQEHAAKIYNRRKFILAKGDQAKMEKQAGRPMQGPWYFLYLKPNWVLKAAPMVDEFIGHEQYWYTLVERVIAPFYKISDQNLIASIKNIPYSMPRGRVSEYQLRNGPRTWIAVCGNDFVYSKKEQQQILSEFNLYQQFAAGLVRFVPDDHEVMLPVDHRRFLEIVTQLDPQNQKRIKLIDPDKDPEYMDLDDDAA